MPLHVDMELHALQLWYTDSRKEPHMKTIKDKQLLMGADWAGFPLKEAVKAPGPSRLR